MMKVILIVFKVERDISYDEAMIETRWIHLLINLEDPYIYQVNKA